MAATDGYLRSSADKSEGGNPSNLRLRSQADKLPAAGVLAEVMTVTLANISEVLSTLKANIDTVMGIGTS